MNEREAKLKALYIVLRDEFWKCPFNLHESAERILQEIEQVEREYEYAR